MSFSNLHHLMCPLIHTGIIANCSSFYRPGVKYLFNIVLSKQSYSRLRGILDVDDVLLTYRAFASPLDLISSLIERFEKPNVMNPDLQKQARFKYYLLIPLSVLSLILSASEYNANSSLILVFQLSHKIPSCFQGLEHHKTVVEVLLERYLLVR